MKTTESKWETNYSFFKDNALLNKDYGIAAIAGKVEVFKGKQQSQDKDFKPYIESQCEFLIADCNKKIHLELGLHDNQFNNSISKLTILKNMLDNMIKHMKKAKKHFDKLNKQMKDEER